MGFRQSRVYQSAPTKASHIVPITITRALYPLCLQLLPPTAAVPVEVPITIA